MAAYSEVLDRIYARDVFGSRPGLERIRLILKELGEPQKKLKFAIVAGSNGKGSTTAMVGSVLKEAGIFAGAYFSPHIVDFRERILIGGRKIPKSLVAETYHEVSEACLKAAPEATFFEFVTAMALLAFERQGAEFAVLEAGLGGRLDATNAVEPEVSAITSISLEHTDVLGKTIGKIAYEKCGIAREGKPLVCAPLSAAAKKAVARECARLKAKAVFLQDEMRVGQISERGGKYSFAADFGKKHYEVSLSCMGKFQISNACCALAVCSLLGIGEGAIERGLKKAKPKFRLERIERFPDVIADCAHNPEAARALSEEVKKIDVSGKRVLLFSAMKDKDYRSELGFLAPNFDRVVVTQVALKRSESVEKLACAAKAESAGAVAEKDAKKAFCLAKKLAGKGGAVVIAGSMYLLAELFGKDKKRLAQ